MSGFRTFVGLCAGRVGQLVVYGGERSEPRHGIRETHPRGLVGELTLLEN